MSVLYYAMGGGLGHLTRARSFLRALGLERAAVILTASEFADDRRVVGDIPVIPWSRDTIQRLAPERIIVDTFPAGLFGEIQAPRVDYVARYLRWSAYAPRNMPQFERTYVLEPLDDEHDRFIEEHSRVVIRDFEFEDALPAVSWPAFVLVIHSGPPDEIDELIAYARDVCAIERITQPILLCAPAGLHRADVHCVDVYPATPLTSTARLVFTGGGFNAMRQFGGDPRHRPLPFPRRFDDQHRRVAHFRNYGLALRRSRI